LAPRGEVIASSWWRSTLWWILLCIAAGIGLVLFHYEVAPTSPRTLVIGIVEGFALALAVAYVSIFFVWVRSVELRGSGVTFVLGFRRVEVAWKDLVPPNAPYSIIVTFRYRRNGVVNTNDALAITKSQARAILTDSRCPSFSLDAKILQSLGLAR